MVIDNRDFEEVIRKLDSPATLFYCDPPYHTTEKYYKNIGEEGFSEADHIRLRDTLLEISGKFILSYNDDEFIRLLYDHPKLMLQSLVRPNPLKNRYEKGAQFKELLIANYDMNETAQLTLFQ